MITVLNNLHDQFEIIRWKKSPQLNSTAFENRDNALINALAQFEARLEIKLGEFDDPTKLNMFVRNVQVELTKIGDGFCNSVNGQLSESEWVEDQALRRRARESLMDILYKLHKYFATGFDCSLTLPNCFSDMEQNRWHLVVELSRKNIDARLIDTLGKYLNSPLDPTNLNIVTWRQVIYLNDLANVLCNFRRAQSREDNNLRLILLLIRNNFNCNAFYEYMLEYINTIAANEGATEGEVYELKTLSSRIKDLRTEKPDGYDSSMPAIRETLLENINGKLAQIKIAQESEYEQIVNNKAGINSTHFLK